MTLVGLIILLLVVGVALAFLPINPTIRNLIVGVICLCVLLVLLSFFGLLPSHRFAH